MKNKSSDTSLISILSEIKASPPLKFEVGEMYKIYHTDNRESYAYDIYMFLGLDESDDYIFKLFDERGKIALSEPFEVSKDIINNKDNKKRIEKFEYL
jgi:hypothetical protein